MKTGKIVILFTVLVAVLFVISYFATIVEVFTYYAEAEIHIFVSDEDGKPIEGVALDVYNTRTKKYAFKAPFLNYEKEGTLITDADGKIICNQRELEEVGNVWYVFWIIPVDNLDANICILTHKKYEEFKILCSELQKSLSNNFRDGAKSEKIIIKHKIVLKEKNKSDRGHPLKGQSREKTPHH